MIWSFLFISDSIRNDRVWRRELSPIIIVNFRSIEKYSVHNIHVWPRFSNGLRLFFVTSRLFAFLETKYAFNYLHKLRRKMCLACMYQDDSEREIERESCLFESRHALINIKWSFHKDRNVLGVYLEHTHTWNMKLFPPIAINLKGSGNRRERRIGRATFLAVRRKEEKTENVQ